MDFEDTDKFQSIIDEKNKEISELTNQLTQEKLNFNNQLREIQDYYESILAVMPGHVSWLDKNNVFLGCNNLQARDARLPSRKDIIGKTNHDMPWKDRADELNRISDEVMQTGELYTAEEYSVMANGLAIYDSQIIPLRNQHNEIIGVLRVASDITEQKKMEAALRRAKEAAEVANHAKTEFIANMGHDIHTPLSGIVGMSKLLEDRITGSEEKQFVHWINESGNQLLKLLQRVLTVVSDNKINESDITEEIFDLRKSAEGIAHLVFPTVKMKKLNLQLNIDSAVPHYLITDGTKLHRVLLNLVGNAIKFTEKGSITIDIKVLVDDKEYVQIEFSVSDTGMGIPDALQTKIFDRFFRVSPSRKEGYGGHGVGLHIAQNYVGLLGGEIKLTSELGVGSTFYFTLPMKVARKENVVIEKNQNDAPLSTVFATSYNLLLVEANIIALRFLESLAIQTNCRFASATDAEHALKLVKSMDFDLILTDVELPKISGHELTHQIRAWEKMSHRSSVPIIGLTAHNLDESSDCSKSEMNKIISKPVQLATIQELIQQFVAVEKK